MLVVLLLALRHGKVVIKILRQKDFSEQATASGLLLTVVLCKIIHCHKQGINAYWMRMKMKLQGRDVWFVLCECFDGCRGSCGRSGCSLSDIMVLVHELLVGVWCWDEMDMTSRTMHTY